MPTEVLTVLTVLLVLTTCVRGDQGILFSGLFQVLYADGLVKNYSTMLNSTIYVYKGTIVHITTTSPSSAVAATSQCCFVILEDIREIMFQKYGAYTETQVVDLTSSTTLITPYPDLTVVSTLGFLILITPSCFELS
jgi:hypothetical protein